MDSDSPLAQYTIDELWAEIAKRFDAAAMVFVKDLDANQYQCRLFYCGVHPSVLGLLEMARARLRKDAGFIFCGSSPSDPNRPS